MPVTDEYLLRSKKSEFPNLQNFSRKWPATIYDLTVIITELQDNSHLKGITHGGGFFIICIKLGILSLCIEP